MDKKWIIVIILFFVIGITYYFKSGKEYIKEIPEQKHVVAVLPNKPIENIIKKPEIIEKPIEIVIPNTEPNIEININWQEQWEEDRK